MRLSSPPPVRCSSCFAQKVEEPHVDFESAWDGPTFDQGIATDQGIVRNLTVAIDDLHICKSCLEDAGRYVGLGNVEEHTERIERLEAQADNLRDLLAKADAYAEQLEGTVAAKPQRRQPAKRRPKVEA